LNIIRLSVHFCEEPRCNCRLIWLGW